MSTNTTIGMNGSIYGSVNYIVVFRVDTDTMPERDTNVIDIPGRNGSLLIDNGKYHDVEMSYDMIFYPAPSSSYTSVAYRVREFKTFMKSLTGYFRLTDGDFPNEFYIARLAGDIVPVFTPDRRMAKIRLTFMRKPQRFLTSGETRNGYTKTSSETKTITINGAGNMPALPLLEVYGSGSATLKVNDQIITFGNIDGNVSIDSEMMDCFKGSLSQNGNVTFSNNKFPVLLSSTNNIEMGTGITSLYVTPRWWRL